MKRVLILSAVVVLSFSSCSSMYNSNAFNNNSDYQELMGDVEEVQNIGIKEYANEKFSLNETSETAKAYYQIAFLKDSGEYNDTVYFENCAYQIYGTGERITMPNKEILDIMPKSYFPNALEITVNSIKTYTNFNDLGYSSEAMAEITSSILASDGTISGGMEFVAVTMQMTGNTTYSLERFDIYNLENNILAPIGANAFLIGENLNKSTVSTYSILKNEIATFTICYIIDQTKYDYDNLYFTLDCQNLNYCKSYIPLGEYVGDGEVKIGVSQADIKKLDDYYYSQKASEKDVNYYNQVRDYIVTGKEKPFNLKNYSEIVYTLDEFDSSVSCSYPNEHLINSFPERYETDKWLYNVELIKFTSNTYQNIMSLEDFRNMYNHETQPLNTELIDSDGYFLDENGERSENLVAIRASLTVKNSTLTTRSSDYSDEFALYYIADETSEPINISQIIYPMGQTTYLTTPGESSPNVHFEHLVNTEKYPLDKLYLIIGFDEENYKKSIIYIGDALEAES